MKRLLSALICLVLALCCTLSLIACDTTDTTTKAQTTEITLSSTYNIFTKTLTVYVVIDPAKGYAGIAAQLPFDSEHLTYKSHKTGLSDMVVNPSEDTIAFSYASTENVMKKTQILAVTFTYSNTPFDYEFTLKLTPENFVNADLEEQPFTVTNTSGSLTF